MGWDEVVSAYALCAMCLQMARRSSSMHRTRGLWLVSWSLLLVSLSSRFLPVGESFIEARPRYPGQAKMTRLSHEAERTAAICSTSCPKTAARSRNSHRHCASRTSCLAQLAPTCSQPQPRRTFSRRQRRGSASCRLRSARAKTDLADIFEPTLLCSSCWVVMRTVLCFERA